MELKEKISNNLIRLRTAKGLTQGDLAKRSCLTTGGYRKIEKGKVEPGIQSLQNIAEVLDVRISDLVREVPKLKAVRFRALRAMKRREQILAETALWLQAYNYIEKIVKDKVENKLDEIKRKSGKRDKASNFIRKAANEARIAYSLRADEPVYDISGLLEDNGIKVYSVQLNSEVFFGLAVAEEDGGPAVVVNTHPGIPVERWIFSAVHELGHLILHDGAFDVSIEKDDRREETEASMFASWFLMPEQIFNSEWDATKGMNLYDRVLKIKRIFKVSYKTVLTRLTHTYNTPYKELIISFQKHSLRKTGKTLRKKDEPEPLSRDSYYGDQSETRVTNEPEPLSAIDFKQDRLSRLVREAIERDKITMARGAEILKLQYDEMRELSLSWR